MEKHVGFAEDVVEGLSMTQMPDELARKSTMGKGGKGLRLLASVLDPRAWLHLLKLVNFYNYTHVAPMRRMSIGMSPSISPDASFSHGERIDIGDRVRIGSRCHIWPGPAHSRIIIGDDVLFGPEVMITAGTYRFNDGSPVTDQAMDEADVIIGDDVWLGTRAVVLPGCTIGDGAIVAAGALVRNDVPPGAIVAGLPARVVGHRQPSAASFSVAS